MHVVLDTNVLVAALLSSKGASHKILRYIRSGAITIHLSVALVCEYEDVLKRKDAHYQLPFTHAQVDELLDIFCAIGKSHKIWYLWRPLLQDRNDDFVAELAITADVDYIITHNVKHFTALHRFKVRVVTPQEFLYEFEE